MSILINGLKMPTDYPLWIVVSADGTVQYNYFNEWKTAEEKAVPVPPHGRLIDADRLKSDNPRHMNADVPYVTEITVEEIIDAAPTIIKAEPEDEDDTPICTKASLASIGIYKKAEEGE